MKGYYKVKDLQENVEEIDQVIRLEIYENVIAAIETGSNLGIRKYHSLHLQRRQSWAGLGMRVATQLAAKGGFDYVAWVPGYFQNKRWGDAGDGPATFYDKFFLKLLVKRLSVSIARTKSRS